MILTSAKPHIAFYTLGCKVNFSESSFISDIFYENGYQVVPFSKKADIYVINTCGVTSAAVKKSRQIISSVKHKNPQAFLVVTGCITDTDAAVLDKLEHIDLVIGTNEKDKIYQSINTVVTQGKPPAIKNTDGNDFFASYSLGGRTRAFVKIQDGCDYFCAYCVIPYARGRSRSNQIKNIVRQVEKITEAGIKEVVLTGINIGDFKNDKKETLTDLCETLEAIEPLQRLRLSSIEPDLLSDALIRLISTSSKIMPHLHLPLQSGTDKVLKRMNRRYDTAFFAEKVFKIKKNIPDCCIGTDVIAGFPGESIADFEAGMDFIEKLPLSYIHVFPYSSRPQAQSSGFENALDQSVIKNRTLALKALAKNKKELFFSSQKGKVHRILFEHINRRGFIYGFSENYVRVKTGFRKTLANSIVKAPLSKIDEDGVFLLDSSKEFF